MVPFLRERRAKHFLTGGDLYHFFYLGVPYWNLFESMFAEHGLSSTQQLATVYVSVQESLLYMMAADVVVSTSSSFTDIVALFSAFPVVINPPPMHGFSSSWIEYVNHFSYISIFVTSCPGIYLTVFLLTAGPSVQSQTMFKTYTDLPT